MTKEHYIPQWYLKQYTNKKTGLLNIHRLNDKNKQDLYQVTTDDLYLMDKTNPLDTKDTKAVVRSIIDTYRTFSKLNQSDSEELLHIFGQMLVDIHQQQTLNTKHKYNKHTEQLVNRELTIKDWLAKMLIDYNYYMVSAKGVPSSEYIIQQAFNHDYQGCYFISLTPDKQLFIVDKDLPDFKIDNLVFKPESMAGHALTYNHPLIGGSDVIKPLTKTFDEYTYIAFKRSSDQDYFKVLCRIH